MSSKDLSELSMLDLFRTEADSQVQVLTTALLALERDPKLHDQLESCMRAAHSLKGAARIVGITAGVGIAHAMEDGFVAAQQGLVTLYQPQIDKLLEGIDLLRRIARTPESELGRWDAELSADVNTYVAALTRTMETGAELPPAQQDAMLAEESASSDTVQRADRARALEARDGNARAASVENPNQHLRVTAEDLNRLLGLASESLVESRWVQPFTRSLLRLKRMQDGLARSLEQLHEAQLTHEPNQSAQTALASARQATLECQQFLSQRLAEIDTFDRRIANLSQRLYDGTLACRMRPFADGVLAFPRMVRDVARTLGKQARLEIVGDRTQVDRDMLEKLEAPLGHLLRNAVDHGLEPPEERRSLGKPSEGAVRLEAYHNAGQLHVVVSDDGRGVDLDALRRAVVARKLTNDATAARLGEDELLEFLFLPSFTMTSVVTEISGRGVGLDAVQDMVRNVRGHISISTQPGKGTRFHLQLPLTLCVVRALLVEIGGEPYAIPLVHISRALKLSKTSIATLEGRQHFDLDGRRIGLVSAHQIFAVAPPDFAADELSVVVVGELDHAYGLIVDRLLSERELVVQPLDARFGKVKDIASGAVLEDGSPTLVIDVDDLMRSVAKLIESGDLARFETSSSAAVAAKRKRVLIVDDSLTVRELQRKLLDHSGYDVEVAVDGLEGWNAVRTGGFDLVITDIDMPRMDGIELVTLLKKDARVRSLPVMIVSYKDRPEDRRRGLEAGADYYLTKSSFHDDTLLQAVTDLIGGAHA